MTADADATLTIGRVRKSGVFAAGALAVITALTPMSGGQDASAARPRAEILYRIETKDPVVFVTIDDGWHQPEIAGKILRRVRWPITSFLLPENVESHWEYFRDVAVRNDIGTHTANHRILKGLPFEVQKKEICEGEERVRRVTGGTTGYFRPPTGSWDETTLEAAAACGISKVLLWKVSMNGWVMTTWGGPIRAGDIVLVHYVDSIGLSFKRLRREMESQGLRPAILTDYINGVGAPLVTPPARLNRTENVSRAVSRI